MSKYPTVQDIYTKAVELGIKNDPRAANIIERKLQSAKDAQKACKTDLEKHAFDEDTIWNPYGDTRFLAGNKDAKVKKIAFGIDIETQEIMLINELNNKGAGIDLAIAHHPEDRGLLGLGDVMGLQVDVYKNEGIPVNITEKLMGGRISDVNNSIHAVNYNRAGRAAELLGVNFMCIHTPCDNHVYQFLTNIFKGQDDLLLKDVVKQLQEIPEFAEGTRMGNAPNIVSGSSTGRAGKIVATEITGGTSGSEDIYEKLAIAGVGTVLSMHCGKKHEDEAKKHGINIIVTGHMAADSVGINLLLDEYEKQGVEIVPMSGLIRYSRVTNSFVK